MLRNTIGLNTMHHKVNFSFSVGFLENKKWHMVAPHGDSVECCCRVLSEAKDSSATCWSHSWNKRLGAIERLPEGVNNLNSRLIEHKAKFIFQGEGWLETSSSYLAGDIWLHLVRGPTAQHLCYCQGRASRCLVLLPPTPLPLMSSSHLAHTIYSVFASSFPYLSSSF